MSEEIQRITKDLHAKEADTTRLGSYKQRIERFYREKNRVPKDYKQRALEFLETVPDTPRCLHGDLHIGNIITDGKQFDSSRGGVPLACRLCDLIEGWIIAMQQMHIGDKWELYIPAEMGYGKFSQPGIPGGSTLIFEIELLGIA